MSVNTFIDVSWFPGVSKVSMITATPTKSGKYYEWVGDEKYALICDSFFFGWAGVFGVSPKVGLEFSLGDITITLEKHNAAEKLWLVSRCLN